MLEIGSIMMQSVAVDAAIATVVSYATLIGLIGTIVVAAAAFLKTRTQNPQICKALSDIQDIGRLTTAFSQKTVEQQKDLKTVAQVLTTLSPEAKKLLEDNKKSIEYWKEKANVATQQLNKLLPMIPREAQANNMTDLPRENKQTLETTNTGG